MGVFVLYERISELYLKLVHRFLTETEHYSYSRSFFTAVSVVYWQYSLGPKLTFICSITIWFIFNQADALTFHTKVILFVTFVARFSP